MKTLILVRHAKSSWDNLALDDFDRPLNERGKRDAPRVAKYLKASNIIPQHVISSPAKRARKTAKIFAECLLGDASEINLISDVYGADVDDLFNIVRNVDEGVQCCMLVGHNPGMTELANFLIRNHKDRIDNVPTTGVVILNLDLSRWQLLSEGSGVLSGFIYPGLLPEDVD